MSAPFVNIDHATPMLLPPGPFIIRSSGGTLRAVKNLCVGALIEAVKDRTKAVDPKQVNARPAPASLASSSGQRAQQRFMMSKSPQK